jgi:hypothetical protein
MHCAAQNNNVDILQFIQESLEGFELNAMEKVRLFDGIIVEEMPFCKVALICYPREENISFQDYAINNRGLYENESFGSHAPFE